MDLGPNFGASSKMLRFCSNFRKRSILVSRFHTPNMSKIEALLTMPKILDPIFLTMRRKRLPNFYYVVRKWLIYLENGLKVLGNIGHWDPFLTGTPYFRCLEMAAMPKRSGLGPKFFRLRNHHTGYYWHHYQTKILPTRFISQYLNYLIAILLIIAIALCFCLQTSQILANCSMYTVQLL